MKVFFLLTNFLFIHLHFDFVICALLCKMAYAVWLRLVDDYTTEASFYSHIVLLYVSACFWA